MPSFFCGSYKTCSFQKFLKSSIAKLEAIAKYFTSNSMGGALLTIRGDLYKCKLFRKAVGALLMNTYNIIITLLLYQKDNQYRTKKCACAM